ncbi:MAG: fumarylacetoacetate hydrolase family protein [Planctomycetes bacterium]|nr:fumarylacetoacetate hydrolase family protein [Planctomycetota bacterium]
MHIIRFLDPQGRERCGQRVADEPSARLIEGDLFGPWRVTGETARVAKLLAPVQPRAILCIGLNYRRHAEETGAKIPDFPVLFVKNPAAVQNPGDPIVLPASEPEVDYECELAVVIGKAAKHVAREQALSHVLGYTCANDVSGRTWQLKRGGSQWCRGKSFDTFCPLGPGLVTPEDIPNPNALKLKTLLNGQVMQDWTTEDMIFDVPSLISFLSQSTTLLPGTVILTGTPQGVGMARKPPVWLKDGDRVAIEVERIGRLENPVQAE